MFEILHSSGIPHQPEPKDFAKQAFFEKDGVFYRVGYEDFQVHPESWVVEIVDGEAYVVGDKIVPTIDIKLSPEPETVEGIFGRLKIVTLDGEVIVAKPWVKGESLMDLASVLIQTFGGGDHLWERSIMDYAIKGDQDFVSED